MRRVLIVSALTLSLSSIGVFAQHDYHSGEDASPGSPGDPGKTGELVWHFTEVGTVDFARPLPDHFKGMNFPGMKGTIEVGAK